MACHWGLIQGPLDTTGNQRGAYQLLEFEWDQLRIRWHLEHWGQGPLLLTWINSDTGKLTGPRTLADKRWVGPVKLLCITMFDISKIRQKSVLGLVKCPKILAVSVRSLTPGRGGNNFEIITCELLYGLYGTWCPLFPKRQINLMSLSLSLSFFELISWEIPMKLFSGICQSTKFIISQHWFR